NSRPASLSAAATSAGVIWSADWVVEVVVVAPTPALATTPAASMFFMTLRRVGLRESFIYPGYLFISTMSLQLKWVGEDQRDRVAETRMLCYAPARRELPDWIERLRNE